MSVMKDILKFMLMMHATYTHSLVSFYLLYRNY